MSSEVRTVEQSRQFRSQLVTVAVMYMGYAALMLCRNTLGAAGVSMLEDPSLDLDKAQFGRLLSWSSAGAIAGKLITGVSADRWGGRRMFLVALLLTALSTAISGAVSGFYLFAGLNFGGQFFKAGAWPAVAKIIGAWFPSHQHGRVWSIISTSSRVGTLSASLLIGGLLSVISWRSVFVFSAALAMVPLLAAWFWLRDQPRPRQDCEPNQNAQAGRISSEPDHPLDGKTLREACQVFVGSPRVWLLCLAIACLSILLDVFAFIPIYIRESTALQPGHAVMMTGAFPAGMFAALVATSIYYDRLSKRQLMVWNAAFLILACCCIGALWVLPGMSVSAFVRLPAMLAALFVFGFTVAPAYYIPMSVFSISFGGQRSGFLVNIIDVFGYAGSLIFLFFGGSIAQNYGWPVFFSVLLGVALLALLTTTAFLHLEDQVRPA